MLATQYAKALHAELTKEPARAKELFANLREALARRGHNKLLPQIATELERLEVARGRAARAREATPGRERTRVLFELYKHLTRHSAGSL